MRDETARDQNHAIILNEDITGFGVDCDVMVSEKSGKLSDETRVRLTFAQESGVQITHELTISETMRLGGLIHNILTKLNDIAKKQGVDV